MSDGSKFVAVVRCCREWPVYKFIGWGKCGLCGQRPELIEKTIEQYMREREQAREGL